MAGSRSLPATDNASLGKDFSGRAAAYKDFRPRYPEKLFDFIAEKAPARALAWDCGCGNGQSALPLGDRFARVIATDVSPAQLKHAEQHPRVSYVSCSAEASCIATDSVDALVVTQAVHWFQFDRFYTEVRRVSRSGGLLVVAGYGLLQVDPAVDTILRCFYIDTVGRFWPAERRFLDEEYQTIPFPFTAIEAPTLEIQLDWDLDTLLGYLATWTAVENYRAAHQTDPLLALRTQLESHWRGTRTVRWPLYIRAGHV